MTMDWHGFILTEWLQNAIDRSMEYNTNPIHFVKNLFGPATRGSGDKWYLFGMDDTFAARVLVGAIEKSYVCNNTRSPMGCPYVSLDPVLQKQFPKGTEHLATGQRGLLPAFLVLLVGLGLKDQMKSALGAGERDESQNPLLEAIQENCSEAIGENKEEIMKMLVDVCNHVLENVDVEGGKFLTEENALHDPAQVLRGAFFLLQIMLGDLFAGGNSRFGPPGYNIPDRAALDAYSREGPMEEARAEHMDFADPYDSVGEQSKAWITNAAELAGFALVGCFAELRVRFCKLAKQLVTALCVESKSKGGSSTVHNCIRHNDSVANTNLRLLMKRFFSDDTSTVQFPLNRGEELDADVKAFCNSVRVISHDHLFPDVEFQGRANRSRAQA